MLANFFVDFYLYCFLCYVFELHSLPLEKHIPRLSGSRRFQSCIHFRNREPDPGVSGTPDKLLRGALVAGGRERLGQLPGMLQAGQVWSGVFPTVIILLFLIRSVALNVNWCLLSSPLSLRSFSFICYLFTSPLICYLIYHLYLLSIE